MKIVFMGTPDFAVPTLEALLKGKHEVVGVFCQPDKAKGRGQKLQKPPVKEVALAHDVPVFQPNHFSDEGVRETLESLHPDLMVVIAYGKLLPKWVLDLAPYGCINLHGSILPAYRGAAPIQWSILNGDTETGITVMKMNEGMDTGDILKVIRTPIGYEETSGELFERLALLAGETIESIVDDIEGHRLIGVPQREEKATYTKKITKEMGLVNWHRPAKEIFSQMKGLSPWPGTFSYLEGTRMKLWRALPHEESTSSPCFPGAIVAVGKDSFTVQTVEGLLEIFEIQLDNKKRMSVSDFLKGYTIEKGQRFSNEPTQI